ncbi:hypothetical protein DTO169C6_2931 [Paecilomyces variotii]|nr:hypothetical protein DTO169C6_2931 [Paecilomyces variotii]KAJ9384177.1 hypothetical protein DTO063F5_4910 [Paecilomyces variotii]
MTDLMKTAGVFLKEKIKDMRKQREAKDEEEEVIIEESHGCDCGELEEEEDGESADGDGGCDCGDSEYESESDCCDCEDCVRDTADTSPSRLFYLHEDKDTA